MSLELLNNLSIARDQVCLFIVVQSLLVQAALVIFLATTSILIKVQISKTESALLETQDFAVTIGQFTQLAKDNAYDLGELKVALYLYF